MPSREQRILQQRRARLRRIAAGLCVRCGRPSRPGYRMCLPCAVDEADRKLTEYHRKRGHAA